MPMRPIAWLPRQCTANLLASDRPAERTVMREFWLTFPHAVAIATAVVSGGFAWLFSDSGNVALAGLILMVL